MPKELGDSVVGEPDTQTITGDGSASAGDAVAINTGDGDTDQASTTAAVSNFFGIAKADFGSDGDEEAVHTAGTVVANVDSGVQAGEGLNVTSTAGRLGNTTDPVDNKAIAVSDEGGTFAGASLGSNEAAITFPR